MVEKYNHFFGLYLQVIKDVYDPEKPYDNLKDCIRHCERFREQLIGMVKLIAEMGEFTREAADKEVERIIEKCDNITEL